MNMTKYISCQCYVSQTFLCGGNVVPEPFYLSDQTLVTQIICYDLRFPEILRYPARKGAKIAFYVAQWPSSRLDHWLSLLKSESNRK